MYTGYTSDHFIVGVTDVSPEVKKPTLWDYTVCGQWNDTLPNQYPGAVPNAATVSLHCVHNLPPFRYVIVQLPQTTNMNFCEVEVIAPGTSLSTSDGNCKFQTN